MRNVRFATVILTIVLVTLGVVTTALLVPTYLGSSRALQEELNLGYERDQLVLERLFRESLSGVRQLAFEAARSNDIMIGTMTRSQELIEPALDALVSGTAGERIDAFVVEYNNGEMLAVPNVSLFGLALPLERLSANYQPFDNWGVQTADVDNNFYALLRLTQPIVDNKYGEVIGKLHVYILLNENFWIINEIKELSGSSAVVLKYKDQFMGGLASSQEALQALAQVQLDRNFREQTDGILRRHSLTFGTSESFEVLTQVPNVAYQMLRNAFFSDLLWSLSLVIGAGLAAVLLIHFLIRTSLSRLVAYTEAVLRYGSAGYQESAIQEFNRVGDAVRTMVDSLQERDKQLAGIMDNSPGTLFLKDAEHRYLLANQKLASSLGRDIGQIIGHTDAELYPDHILQEIRRMDRIVLDRGECVAAEIDLPTPVGPRTFLVNKFPLLDEQGRPYAVGGISTDITERKQAEDRLKLANQVFEETREAILIFDGDNRIITCNAAFRRMTGLGDGETPHHLCLLENNAQIRSQLQRLGHWQGESEQRRLNGSRFPVWLSVSEVAQRSGDERHYVAVFSDITQLKETEQRLEKLAHYDCLTGLPNRSLFFDRFEQSLVTSRRNRNKTALLFLDVDRFKSINDNHGHDAGDQLLVQVADRIQQCLRPGDTISRLGGDEFTMVLADLTRPETIDQMAQKVLTALRAPFNLDSGQFFISGSIGIAIYPDDGADTITLLKHADIAMYQAKESGRNNFRFFDPATNASLQARNRLEEGLRRAIGDEELFLQFQPRFDVAGTRICGAEALLRWQHPERGYIPPGEFIPLAESSDLIIEIGRFVLARACTAAYQWVSEGHRIPVSVNLSPRQLRDRRIIDDVRKALENSALPPRYLELEITETHVIEDLDQVCMTLNKLRDMGVRLSVDDFGTGYSSLIYLKKLPVSTVKIDRSFVADVPGDPDDESIVEAIIQMAHTLRMTVVAEGVETDAQRAYLEQLGCDEVQGFLLARPDSAEKLKALNRGDKARRHE